MQEELVDSFAKMINMNMKKLLWVVVFSVLCCTVIASEKRKDQVMAANVKSSIFDQTKCSVHVNKIILTKMASTNFFVSL